MDANAVGASCFASASDEDINALANSKHDAVGGVGDDGHEIKRDDCEFVLIDTEKDFPGICEL